MEKTIKSILDEHEQQLKAVSDELKDLENESHALQETIRDREAAEARLMDLEDERSGLLGERERLAGAYAAALFEDDQQAIGRIRDRRAEIDSEAAELEQAITGAEQQVKEHQVDGRAVAAFVVRAERGVRYPDVEEPLDRVSTVLQEQVGLLRTRKGALVSGLAGYYSHADLHEARMELDAAYRTEERRWQQREQKREQEDRRFWREAYDDVKSGKVNLDSTDAVHAARGQRRSISPASVVNLEDEVYEELSR